MKLNKHVALARSGVYQYSAKALPMLGLSVPPGLQSKQSFGVYRPPEVLDAAKDKFTRLPVTLEHPPELINGSNYRQYALGFTGDSAFSEWTSDGKNLVIKSSLSLIDNEAVNAYYNGVSEVSPGYTADFGWQDGVSPDGEAFDIIMKGIKDVNHLALTRKGRGGTEICVLDSELADKRELEALGKARYGEEEVAMVIKDSEKPEADPKPKETKEEHKEPPKFEEPMDKSSKAETPAEAERGKGEDEKKEVEPIEEAKDTALDKASIGPDDAVYDKKFSELNEEEKDHVWDCLVSMMKSAKSEAKSEEVSDEKEETPEEEKAEGDEFKPGETPEEHEAKETPEEEKKEEEHKAEVEKKEKASATLDSNIEPRYPVGGVVLEFNTGKVSNKGIDTDALFDRRK